MVNIYQSHESYGMRKTAEVVQQVFWSSMHLCAPWALLPVQRMLPHARRGFSLGAAEAFPKRRGFLRGQVSDPKTRAA